ncbi:MAG TPA: FAD-dependent oxidoreductase, partial [Chloroflexota bacterium]|nr:FAD-dependent oxidoreductase [Chloroflexota bacterium]
MDAYGLAANTELQADVCIIGGGPAGLTIARELAGGDLRICLLES